MFGDVLPGTALADWLERVKADPHSIDRTRHRIEVLLRDPGVASRVQANLRQDRAMTDVPAAAILPGWLKGFVTDTDGALRLHFRLGETGRRVALMRLQVLGGASTALAGVVGR